MSDKLLTIEEEGDRAGLVCRCGWASPLRRKVMGLYMSGVVVQEARMHLDEEHAD